jgi:hypothetical protein
MVWVGLVDCEMARSDGHSTVYIRFWLAFTFENEFLLKINPAPVSPSPSPSHSNMH